MIPKESYAILIAVAVATFIPRVKSRQSMTEILNRILGKIGYSESVNDYSFLNINVNDVRLRATPDELINYYGYVGEKHTVITADGYILTLHRIAGKNTNNNIIGKPVVFLQHGIICSSMDWIIAGPARSLAFLLSDFGMDVWLGNSRGNAYSRAHVTMKPSRKEFWNFSWNEMGIYDLPSVIDYILSTTGNEQLTYIGHSQGTTISYVLLSERPEYNKKISLLISLAPVAFGVPASPLALLSRLIDTSLLQEITNSIDFYEFKQLNDKTKSFVFYFCSKNVVTSRLCKTVMFLLGGVSEPLYDADLYPIIFQHFPAGSSVKQILHYAQLTNSGYFRQFDYGTRLNKIKYGSVQPPDYKLENVQVPTTLFVGKNDLLSTIKEAKRLYNKLRSPNGLYIIPHPTFNHFDFLWGKGVKQLSYKDVLFVILTRYYY